MLNLLIFSFLSLRDWFDHVSGFLLYFFYFLFFPASERLRGMEKELTELFEAVKKAADAAEKSPGEEERCLDALKQLNKFPVNYQLLVSTQVIPSFCLFLVFYLLYLSYYCNTVDVLHNILCYNQCNQVFNFWC